MTKHKFIRVAPLLFVLLSAVWVGVDAQAPTVGYDESQVESFEDDATALYVLSGAPVDIRAANWVARMQFDACSLGYPKARALHLSGLKTALGIAQSGDSQVVVPPRQAPVNGDYQDWFRGLVADKPFGQATLLALEPTLNAAGVKLSPPNHANPPETTKIGIPAGNGQRRVIRVGFGEGFWVWVDLGVVDWP